MSVCHRHKIFLRQGHPAPHRNIEKKDDTFISIFIHGQFSNNFIYYAFYISTFSQMFLPAWENIVFQACRTGQPAPSFGLPSYPIRPSGTYQPDKNKIVWGLVPSTHPRRYGKASTDAKSMLQRHFQNYKSSNTCGTENCLPASLCSKIKLGC